MLKGERYFLSLEISVAPFVAVRRAKTDWISFIIKLFIFYDFCVIFKSPMAKYF